MMEAVNKFVELKRKKRKQESEDDEETKHQIKRSMLKNDPSSAQKIQLDKLMINHHVPIEIPTNETTFQPPKEFIYNVPAASATSGAADFHIYRQARRKEYARMKIMEEEELEIKAKKDHEDMLLDRIKVSMEKTNKKRLKRLKRKKNNGKGKVDGKGDDDESDVESEKEGPKINM